MNGDKIAKVAGVAQSDKQQSALAFKASQQGYDRNHEQLQQLQQFKREYEAKLETMCEQGMAARQLEDYRCFLRKLNQAIDQQAEEMQSSQQDLDAAREQWMSKSRRSSALDQVVDQHQLKQRHERDKAEQRESDDRSMTRGAGSMPES